MTLATVAGAEVPTFGAQPVAFGDTVAGTQACLDRLEARLIACASGLVRGLLRPAALRGLGLDAASAGAFLLQPYLIPRLRRRRALDRGGCGIEVRLVDDVECVLIRWLVAEVDDAVLIHVAVDLGMDRRGQQAAGDQ